MKKNLNKRIESLYELLALQSQNGNWNANPYMMGLYNGMELSLAILEEREPVYMEVPEKWLDETPKTKNPTVAPEGFYRSPVQVNPNLEEEYN